MLFEQIELGPMANYVYLIGDEQSRECAVVDPGWEASAILHALRERGLKLASILVTHNHFDHVGAVGDLLKEADVPVYAHKNDAPALVKIAGDSLRPISGGDKAAVGKIEVAFLHTPGHTAGSQCLSVAGRLLTGDTLFIDGCGRVDLPTSDPEEMAKSLKRISELAPDTVIWPGHNYSPSSSDTIGRQLRSNAYVAAARKNLADFMRLVVPNFQSP